MSELTDTVLSIRSGVFGGIYIYDEELTVWGCTFWYERNAKRAIDRFIANNYKQTPIKDITVIKYP